MSYTEHDSIIVTAFKREYAEAAHAKAIEIGLVVTPIVETKAEGWSVFLIAPDGSKEGWPESSVGDAQRTVWIAWARSQWSAACCLPYKAPFLYWVHVKHHEIGNTARGKPRIVAYQPDGKSEN